MSCFKLQMVRSGIKILLVLIAAIVVRIYCATLGHNYDMESWDLVSDIVLNGDNIYAHTHRYNYGYLWGLILGALKSLMHLLGQHSIENFHLYIVGFLSLIDIGIAAWVHKYFGYKYALLFLFNPISILTTGFHSQFDNLALLFALLSIVPLLKAQVNTKQIVISALLMGVSLSTKHLFFMFPLWFLFRANISVKNRFLFGLVSCGFFVLSFVPFIFSSEAQQGVWNNIITYNGFGANSMFVYIQYFLFSDLLNVDFYTSEIFAYHKAMFLTLLAILGYVFRKQSIKFSVILYPLALLTTTCMILSEYYALAVLVSVIFIKHIEAQLFIAFTTLYLVFVPNAYNIGMLDTLSIFSEQIQYYFLYCLHPNMIQLFLTILLFRLIYMYVVRKEEALRIFQEAQK